MGYVNSSSSSSSEGGRDKSIDQLQKMMTKCMDLISKRNSLVEKLNLIDEEIEEMMTEIRTNPQAAEMAKMLSGLIKPTKRG